MSFDRWQCAWPRTWPYAVFKKHHTELNDLYWSQAAAANHAMATVGATHGTDDLTAILKIPPANARRIASSAQKWQSQFKESQNWIRLNALVALCGYLETYIHAVGTLALTSDPGVLISSPRAVDGLSLVKREALPDLSEHITGLTKGAWSDRVRKYRSLFGTVPATLEKNVSELDAIRKLRNGVGHSFGRLIHEYRSPLLLKPLPVQRLAEERLQRWLGVVDDCVSAIEDHLRSAHIGAVEGLLNYHAWDKTFYAGHTSEEKAFRAQFPDAQGSPPSAKYFRSLIAYFRSA
ncbi:hypothetical protein [Variovorax sp. WS11]|uniref:hypothetical protein n=1 Tax=Variovorax sp. WS11 TaxID=1105204 RepID=UPI0011B24F6E|nr:hypothetical protein [Variovorax sp. WS11]NDZ12700.1 hypothetical protein [Variovorax sp. WS11]